jgi:hypothetical protein
MYGSCRRFVGSGKKASCTRPCLTRPFPRPPLSSAPTRGRTGGRRLTSLVDCSRLPLQPTIDALTRARSRPVSRADELDSNRRLHFWEYRPYPLVGTQSCPHGVLNTPVFHDAPPLYPPSVNIYSAASTGDKSDLPPRPAAPSHHHRGRLPVIEAGYLLRARMAEEAVEEAQGVVPHSAPMPKITPCRRRPLR